MKLLRRSLILCLFIYFSNSIFAQTDWQWGQEVRTIAQHIAADQEGNAYVTWSLQDAYTIDGEPFFSNGANDIALTSFDCDGVHRWTKVIGGNSGDVAWGLGTDTMGGVYVACYVNGGRLPNHEIHIDTDATVISEQKSLMLVKYNSEGEFQWTQMPEDTVVIDPSNLQLAVVFDFDVSPNGDSFMFTKLPIGTYSDNMFEATYSGSVDAGENLYCLRYASDGAFLGGTHLDIWYDGGLFSKSEIIRDHYTGRYYLTGNRNDDDVFIFGGEEVTANNYLVQFDQDGNVNWVISTEDLGEYYTFFNGKPVVDESSNVYIAGNSENGNLFGGIEFQNPLSTTTFPILAKVDPSGDVVFATNANVGSTSKGNAVAYSNNKLALTGFFRFEIEWGDENIVPDADQIETVFLATFDASGNGIPNEIHALYGSANAIERSSLLTADRFDNFYVGGQFSSQLYVGEGTLYNQSGPNEGFIAKFGTDTCYCPLPEAAFEIDSLATQAEYIFAYTGTAEVDSVVWDFGDGTTATELNLEHLFAESGEYTVCVTAYNECGPDSTCITLNALGPVGVRTVDWYDQIAIYPNPARDILTIDNPTPGMRVEIFNSVGQLVQTEMVMQSPAQINVSSLETGGYLMRFFDGSASGEGGVVGYARFLKSD